MMSVKDLFSNQLNVINVGSPSFNEDYEHQGIKYTHLEWMPPANGDVELINALQKSKKYNTEIKQANEEFLTRVKASEGKLIDVDLAINVVPGMTKHTILHAGPKVEYKDMAGPMKGAVMGALIYEGLADTIEEADKLASTGRITFDSAHNHNAVGPMAGIISATMPVHILYNERYGNYSYCTINEGLGKVLRYGANSKEVIDRLIWIRDVFSVVLKEALKLSGGIDIKNIIIQALQMGDECHNRNKASSALFLREIVPYIIETKASDFLKKTCVEYIKNNEHYFLNLSMPYCKVALDSARDIKYASVLTVMSRNGVDFGIQVASSSKWYTAPANYVEGLLFPGFTKEDAAPDIGDSSITETCGIGGFAMGGAPAIVKFVGGEVQMAFDYSEQMHEITAGTHQLFTLPTLDFMPTALGIDILKVVESGILPIINTGMAHKQAGVGQVGAGLVHPPFDCFKNALLEFVDRLGE